MTPEAPLDDHDLRARVEALEELVATMRDEMDERIIVAAHKLRDSKDFIEPFWQKGAGHMGDHMLTVAGRKIFIWIATGIIGALLMWAGSTRFWA